MCLLWQSVYACALHGLWMPASACRERGIGNEVYLSSPQVGGIDKAVDRDGRAGGLPGDRRFVRSRVLSGGRRKRRGKSTARIHS